MLQEVTGLMAVLVLRVRMGLTAQKESPVARVHRASSLEEQVMTAMMVAQGGQEVPAAQEAMAATVALVRMGPRHLKEVTVRQGVAEVTVPLL